MCLKDNPDIDLIILDINMPRLTGLQVLDLVKKKSPYKEIPVVVVSIEDKEENKARCLQAGAAAYFKKPFNGKDLLAVIDRL